MRLLPAVFAECGACHVQMLIRPAEEIGEARREKLRLAMLAWHAKECRGGEPRVTGVKPCSEP